MSGALWAAISGIGFGLFQAFNAHAVRGLRSVYASTFLQLLLATCVLVVAAIATEDVGALADAPVWSLIAFGLAGLMHFLVGWTALNVSQSRIGAARTSPLLATTPLFGLLFAAVLLAEAPGWFAIAAIALTIVGAVMVSDPGGSPRTSLRDSTFALATACAWSISAVLTLEGLDGLDSPLLGVAIGMAAATIAYGLLVALMTRTGRVPPIRARPRSPRLEARRRAPGRALHMGRWLALADAPVAVVMALNLLSVARRPRGRSAGLGTAGRGRNRHDVGRRGSGPDRLAALDSRMSRAFAPTGRS